ncbi:lamin tail domain-containing protein [Patescibacteria group bacterium]|nr:lamin tail domain-containing protein [Patescibacteria group bacterium]
MKKSKPAERKTKKRRGRSEVFCFKKSLTSLVVFVLLVSLNWAGLAAIGRTFGYLNDTENSSENSFVASTLDFSLSGDDFSPLVSPTQNATSTILLQNDGLLDFVYGAKVANASGTLCDFLELEDNINNTYQSLASFTSTTTMFSLAIGLTFDARLTSASKSLQNKMCEFKFVFDGEQLEGAGFSDTEEINRTIASGEWPSVVINKVYYDVAADKGNEGDTSNPDEWIELYNPTDEDINVKDWTIIDNYATSTINANITIPALSFAVVSKNASTWAPGTGYWELPDNVIKIILGEKIGNGLANTADMLVLKDKNGNIVDQMNWGAPSPSWDNYNSNLWNPGVADAPEGHMLARVPSGFDTDQVSDWQDLALPSLTLDYPIGGEVWYVGHDYNILWTATNLNGPDADLSIDIYYSKNSGATWAAIATSTENDGIFSWKVPLFINGYYVPSSHARIKVKATGPENFMVQVATSSEDFCPPIDYDALNPEDQQLVDQLISEGVIDESEVIRGGIEDEEQGLEIIEEDITEEQITDETTEIGGSESNSSAGVLEDDLSCPVGESGTFNSVEQTGSDETTDETIDETADEAVEETVDNIVEETQIEESQEEETLIETEILPETEITTEQGEEQTEIAEQPIAQETIENEQPPAGDTTAGDQETTVIETAPAIEAQPAAAPSDDSGGSGDGGSGSDSGSGSGADSGGADQ